MSPRETYIDSEKEFPYTLEELTSKNDDALAEIFANKNFVYLPPSIQDFLEERYGEIVRVDNPISVSGRRMWHSCQDNELSLADLSRSGEFSQSSSPSFLLGNHIVFFRTNDLWLRAVPDRLVIGIPGILIPKVMYQVFGPMEKWGQRTLELVKNNQASSYQTLEQDHVIELTLFRKIGSNANVTPEILDLANEGVESASKRSRREQIDLAFGNKDSLIFLDVDQQPVRTIDQETTVVKRGKYWAVRDPDPTWQYGDESRALIVDAVDRDNKPLLFYMPQSKARIIDSLEAGETLNSNIPDTAP